MVQYDGTDEMLGALDAVGITATFKQQLSVLQHSTPSCGAVSI